MGKKTKIKRGRNLIIKVRGVPFEPLRWDFQNDGLAGHIYFAVPAGTYEPGADNGAYVYDKYDSARGRYQEVHAATCCTEFPDPHGHKFTEYLYEIARFIHDMMAFRGAQSLVKDR